MLAVRCRGPVGSGHFDCSVEVSMDWCAHAK